MLAISLGYIIVSFKGQENQKDKVYLITPILYSFDGYEAKIKDNNLFDDYFWMPIYIEKKHYKRSKEKIFDAIKKIKENIFAIKEKDFRPEQIPEIFPIILKNYISYYYTFKEMNYLTNYVICYFQFCFLFKKLCIEYDIDYIKYLNHQLNLIARNNYEPNESIIPDIIYLFILLFFTPRNTHNEKMKQIWHCLYEEFLIREIISLLTENNENNIEQKEKTKMILKTIKLNLEEKDNICLENVRKNTNLKIRLLDEFIKDCKNNNIYNTIVDIISNDKQFLKKNNLEKEFNYYIKINISQKMNKTFKKLFNDCSKESKNKIIDIIKNNLHFSEYFPSDIESKVYERIYVSKLYKNKEIQNLDEILDYIFKLKKNENIFFIILCFFQKKFNKKGVFEELENNYGVYLNLDEHIFAKEIDDKINKIKNFNEMFKYIGWEYGSDKDYIQAIIK